MTEPGTTPPEHPVIPLTGGGRVTPITRILWVTGEDLPPGEMSDVAYDLSAKANVVLVHESLAVNPTARRAEMKRLRAEIHGLRAGKLTAWGVVTLDGIRQFGWRWLPSRATTTAAEHLMPLAAVGTAAIAAGVGGTLVLTHHGPPAACANPTSQACIRYHQHHPVHVTLPGKPLSYLGAFEETNQDEPANYSGMETFAKTCGRQPNVALYYSGWNEQFQTGFAQQAAAHGAIPLVQINPEIDPGHVPISLAAIAAGTYDTYLTNYADQVASYRKAVIIGFGHEPNGGWYPWGAGHQSPADFVAAWRHIVDIFHRQGAFNATWLWTVNTIVSSRSASIQQWWPGSGFVTWVGIDGYYRHPDDTWSNVFAPTITELQKFTTAPVLIAETAIGPAGTEPWQLSDMYASIRQNNYLGLVWFDKDVHQGTVYEPYRLEDNPQSANTQEIIAVFRQNTQGWRLTHQRGPADKDTG